MNPTIDESVIYQLDQFGGFTCQFPFGKRPVERCLMHRRGKLIAGHLRNPNVEAYIILLDCLQPKVIRTYLATPAFSIK